MVRRVEGNDDLEMVWDDTIEDLARRSQRTGVPITQLLPNGGLRLSEDVARVAVQRSADRVEIPNDR